jgi:hypothetical protein
VVAIAEGSAATIATRASACMRIMMYILMGVNEVVPEVLFLCVAGQEQERCASRYAKQLCKTICKYHAWFVCCFFARYSDHSAHALEPLPAWDTPFGSELQGRLPPLRDSLVNTLLYFCSGLFLLSLASSEGGMLKTIWML